jgi:hypothetical protein
MKHFLRFGTNAEQKYFHMNGAYKLYDAVVINANMIAFSPKALANFIVKKTTSKPFFIDPITHAFQHNQSFICNKDGNIKKSICKLIDLYGDDLKEQICTEEEKDYLPKQRLSPSDIDDNFIESFTENVLNFQKNVSQEKKVAEYKDYIDFANEEDSSLDLEARFEPDFLVAPYFYIDDIVWLGKNIEMIEKAKKIELEKKVFAQIVIDKKFIEKSVAGDGNELSNIMNAYKNCSADGFLIWIDDYSEHHEISKNLIEYGKLLKGIKNDPTKKIYSLYGSYFSIMLTHSEIGILDGVCHGLEYGEARAVVPVGGGIPTAKFYYYPLHKRIDEAEMFNFLTTTKKVTDYFTDICDCAVCHSIFTDKNFIEKFNENFGNTEESRVKMRNGGFITRHYPSTKTKDNSLRHYLLMKLKEFEKINSEGFDNLIDKLKTDHAEYSKYFNSSDTNHLIEWQKALDELKNE